MKTFCLGPSSAVICMAFAVSGCSSPADPAGRGPAPPPAREFSEQSKSAARALSVGNTLAIQQASTPYAKAILCTSAIDAILARIRSTGAAGINESEARSLESVRAIYFRRLRNAEGSNGKSEAAIRADLAQIATEDASPAEGARVALGCVRDLQSQQSAQDRKVTPAA